MKDTARSWPVKLIATIFGWFALPAWAMTITNALVFNTDIHDIVEMSHAQICGGYGRHIIMGVSVITVVVAAGGWLAKGFGKYWVVCLVLPAWAVGIGVFFDLYHTDHGIYILSGAARSCTAGEILHHLL